MKRFAFLALAAALLAMLLTGCGSSNSADRYNGNVSTTDNGKVNGTNDNMTGEFVGEDGFAENNGAEQNTDTDRYHDTDGNNSSNGSNNNSNNGNPSNNGNNGNSMTDDRDNNMTGNDMIGDIVDDVEDDLDARGRTRSRSGWTSGTGDASNGRSGRNPSTN